MTITVKKRKYKSKTIREADQFEQSIIGKEEKNEKVLFFAEARFLFIILDAHLAHCLLSANAQPKRQNKSQGPNYRRS